MLHLEIEIEPPVQSVDATSGRGSGWRDCIPLWTVNHPNLEVTMDKDYDYEERMSHSLPAPWTINE